MSSSWRWFCFSLPVLLLCLAWPQTLEAFAPDKGMFLVATEGLADPRFHEGVILLIQHDAQGSAGLVVNRTSRLALAQVLLEDSKLVGQGATLSYGGPVEPQTLLALVKVRNDPPEPADEVLGGLYVTGVDVLEEWPEFAGGVVACRAFVGYTGWAPGQLELEIQRGDWRVLPGDEQSVFTGDGVLLWERLNKTLAEQK
jgi:putative transcriptional regulator